MITLMAIPITSKINLDELGLDDIDNASDKRAAKEEIKGYIVDTILDYVSQAKSPVSGGKWKQTLSKEYAKQKAKISGSSKPNMELYGDMLDDLDAEITGSMLKVGFGKEASETSKLKAENHNKFTKRARKTKTPERNFIPRKDQKFKRDILNDIKAIIRGYQDE